MTTRFQAHARHPAMLLAAAVLACPLLLLGACASDHVDEPDGHTRTKTTRTVETPTEKTKVTTTHEKDTQTLPR